jgi:hypothetical protein
MNLKPGLASKALAGLTRAEGKPRATGLACHIPLRPKPSPSGLSRPLAKLLLSCALQKMWLPERLVRKLLKRVANEYALWEYRHSKCCREMACKEQNC